MNEQQSGVVMQAMGEENISFLKEAVWQVLDDMGATGQSCCGYAKAKLRIAFEPFRDADENFDDWLSYEEAKHIVEHVDRGVAVPPFRP